MAKKKARKQHAGKKKSTKKARAGSSRTRSSAPSTPDSSRPNSVQINRAPVLTLWAAVVAEQMGHTHEAALTLGKAVAGLNAQSKGRMLGIFGPPKSVERGGVPKNVGLGEDFWVEICGRPVPAKNTDDGVRAVVKDKPIEPGKVEKYLESKFRDDLAAVTEAMSELAASLSSEQLEAGAYGLYESFRPVIESGRRGWGQKGTLDLELIRSMAAK